MYVLLVSFCCTFSWTLGPVSWLYFSEVMVDTGMGIVVLGFWISGIEQVSTMEFLINSNMGVSGTYWLFASENLLAMIFCIFALKETRGLTDF